MINLFKPRRLATSVAAELAEGLATNRIALGLPPTVGIMRSVEGDLLAVSPEAAGEGAAGWSKETYKYITSQGLTLRVESALAGLLDLTFRIRRLSAEGALKLVSAEVAALDCDFQELSRSPRPSTQLGPDPPWSPIRALIGELKIAVEFNPDKGLLDELCLDLARAIAHERIFLLERILNELRMKCDRAEFHERGNTTIFLQSVQRRFDELAAMGNMLVRAVNRSRDAVRSSTLTSRI